jgi:CHASE3 domain sensor protein
MMMKLELLAQEVAALAHQTTAAVESGNLSVIQRHVANVSRVADEMRREFADLNSFGDELLRDAQPWIDEQRRAARWS